VYEVCRGLPSIHQLPFSTWRPPGDLTVGSPCCRLLRHLRICAHDQHLEDAAAVFAGVAGLPASTPVFLLHHAMIHPLMCMTDERCACSMYPSSGHGCFDGHPAASFLAILGQHLM
jgi:hypothetical protein